MLERLKFTPRKVIVLVLVTGFLSLFSISILNAQTALPDEADKMCVGDPNLDYPKINPQTLQHGLKGMPCWEIDKKTKFRVSGECEKVHKCDLQTYTGLDGKEHPVQVGGDSPVPSNASQSSTGLELPKDEQSGVSLPQGPMQGSEDFNKAWQGEGDSAPESQNAATTRTQETYDETSGTRTIKEFDSDGKIIKDTTLYADGNKLIVEHQPDGTLQGSAYESDGKIVREETHAPDNSRTETTYFYPENDPTMNPQSVTTEKFRPDGSLEQTTTITNYAGTYTLKEMDDEGNMTETTQKILPGQYSATYSPGGELLMEQDSRDNGKSWTYRYDPETGTELTTETFKDSASGATIRTEFTVSSNGDMKTTQEVLSSEGQQLGSWSFTMKDGEESGVFELKSDNIQIQKTIQDLNQARRDVLDFVSEFLALRRSSQ